MSPTPTTSPTCECCTNGSGRRSCRRSPLSERRQATCLEQAFDALGQVVTVVLTAGAELEAGRARRLPVRVRARSVDGQRTGLLPGSLDRPRNAEAVEALQFVGKNAAVFVPDEVLQVRGHRDRRVHALGGKTGVATARDDFV